MSTGDGGTPPVPAGYVPPSLPGQAAGSKSGVLRARTVIVSGPTGAVVGVFVYAAGTTPGPGNSPIASMTNQTADPYGNAVPQGIEATVGGIQATLGISATGFLGLLFSQVSSPPNTAPDVAPVQANASGCEMTISSGISLVSSVPATIGLADSTFGGGTSFISLQANQTRFGVLATAFWDDVAHQLNLPVSGGPFISGEGFHAIGLPSTGGFTGDIRVKKLPWNAVFLDFGLQWTNTTGGTFTCGALPDATYYPTKDLPRRYAMGTGGTPTGDAQAGLIIPAASGALSVFVNASTSGNTTQFACGSYMYPTN